MMGPTQYRMRLFACLAIVLLIHGTALASHVSGAEMTYTCIAPNQYEVKLTLYQYCSDETTETSHFGQYESLSCGASVYFEMDLHSTVDVSPLCISASSACNGGSGSIGIEQLTYLGVITIPSGCNDWVLSFDKCCRNSAITNLSSPSSEDLFIQANLDNTLTPQNNSPQFASIPQLYGCVGTPLNFQQLASDPDGDDLVYSLINARNGQYSAVGYVGGFSGANPFDSGASIDANTGEISVTPTIAQVAVVAVLIEEYRNGVKIGEVVRDIQINIADCTNTIPQIGGINGVTSDYSFSMCTNEAQCFDVALTDSDAGQTITSTVGNLPEGATLSVSGSGNNQTATICWSPTSADIGTHYFTIGAIDDACPIIGENSEIITLTVVDNINDPVSAGSDVSICSGENTALSATSSSGNVASITWSPPTGLSGTTGANVTASPNYSTNYTATMTYTDGCFTTDEVLVSITPGPAATIMPQSIHVCEGSGIQLTGSTDAIGMTFEWFDPAMTSLGPGSVAGFTSSISIVSPSTAGVYNYTLVVTSPNGCSSQETMTVTIGSPSVLASCVNIYVSTSGTASNPGTQASPTSLANAILMAQCNNAVIKLDAGTYDITEPLYLNSYITLEGGFDSGSGWAKTSQPGTTTINRTTANPEGTANAQRLVALYANGAEGFRLQDLTITTENANQPGMSTYGLHLTACSNYDIVRTQLLPGSASAGADGAAGAIGLAGRNGGLGSAGDNDDDQDAGGGGGGGGGSGTTLGSIGGNASGNYNAANNCTVVGGIGGPGGITAGTGGDGTGDTNGCAGGNAGTQAANGGASTDRRSGGGGGGGGNGGCDNGAGGNGGSGGGVLGIFGLTNAGGTGGTEGNDGVDGGNGNDGLSGTTGTLGSSGAYSAGFWVPGGVGSTGTPGSGGSGGRGGGGGGGEGCALCLTGCGSGGGGGGGGGQGGAGGNGGLGGGASFGVYLYNNGPGGNIIQSTVNAGSLGNGGLGAAGGQGGAGGNGGNGSPFGNPEVGIGGNGGDGGDGGNGGSGGDGQPGVSINVHLDSGQALANEQSSFNLAGQPVIQVTNVNCTDTNVDYSGASATWDFDATTNNASPATASGANVQTQYTQIDRYDVALGADNYLGFHNIAIEGSNTPEIVTNATLVTTDVYQTCVGTAVSFESTTLGDTYVWDFSGAISDPGSVQNLTNQFNIAGYYPITLNLISDCCGSSPTKTIFLHVLSTPAVVGSGDVTICHGESEVLSVSGLAGDEILTWSPMANVVSQTNNSITVAPSSTLDYLATILASQTAGGNTVTGCAVTSNFAVTVHDLPQPNLTSIDETCANDGSVTSIPTPSGNYDFVWSNGPTTSNATSSINGNLSTGSYTGTITDISTGCQATETIFVNPSFSLPVLFLATNSISCEGANDGTALMYIFGGTYPYVVDWDGTQLNTSFLSQNSLAAGTYPVSVTDGSGCVANMDVNIPEVAAPSAQASLGSFEPCIGMDGAFYFEGTEGATLTYNFGGANSTVSIEHGLDSVIVQNLTGDVTMNLVSVSNECTTTLGTSVTMHVDICALPISLLNFDLSCVNNIVEFNWSTASEENNDYFSIEGSNDGVNFETIKRIEGHGTTYSQKAYSCSFEKTDLEMIYFRLKQTDFNGSITDYPIVSTNCQYTSTDFNLYPNPSNGQFVIDLYTNSYEEDAQITIIDMMGRIVQSFDKKLVGDISRIFIDVQTIDPGEYVLQLTMGGQVSNSKRFVLF